MKTRLSSATFRLVLLLAAVLAAASASASQQQQQMPSSTLSKMLAARNAGTLAVGATTATNGSWRQEALRAAQLVQEKARALFQHKNLARATQQATSFQKQQQQSAVHTLDSPVSTDFDPADAPDSLSQACRTSLTNYMPGFLQECGSNITLIVEGLDNEAQSAPSNAQVAEACDRCAAQLVTLANNISAACSSDDLLDDFIINIDAVANLVKDGLCAVDPDNTDQRCAVSLASTFSSISFTSQPTVEALDALCDNPCLKLLLQAQPVPEVDIVCLKNPRTDEYCLIEMLAVSFDQLDISKSEDIQALTQTFCSPCFKRMFNLLFASIGGDLPSFIQDMFKFMCFRSENGGVCMTSVFEESQAIQQGSSQLSASAQASVEAAGACQDLTSTCVGTTCEAKLDAVKSSGCCWPLYYTLFTIGLNSNVDTCKQADLATAKSCDKGGSVSISVPLKGVEVDSTFEPSDNLKQAVKKDMARALNVPEDEIETEIVVQDGKLIIQVTITTEEADEATGIKQTADTILESGDMVPAATTSQLRSQGVISSSDSVSLDGAQASTAASNNNGALSVTASVGTLLVAAALAVLASLAL